MADINHESFRRLNEPIVQDLRNDFIDTCAVPWRFPPNIFQRPILSRGNSKTIAFFARRSAQDDRKPENQKSTLGQVRTVTSFLPEGVLREMSITLF
jgi:hypothetical protein